MLLNPMLCCVMLNNNFKISILYNFFLFNKENGTNARCANTNCTCSEDDLNCLDSKLH